MKLCEFFNEGDVFPINKAAPDQKRAGYPPYFSDDEAEKAAYEYNNQAQIDQEDGVLITSENGKEYRIFRNEGESQHFELGEVYLTNDPETNSTEYIDTDGYPDVENLLYHHSKQGYFVPYQEASLGENSAGSSITLYNVKGEKKIYTIDKVSNNGGMIVSGNGLDRIIVNQTLDAVTFNIKDPNYKIQAPGFQMQGRVVRDISPAVLDNAMMTIRNQIKTAPKNQAIYLLLVADFYALKFKKESDLVNSMQQENFADGKKKGKSKPGRGDTVVVRSQKCITGVPT